MKKVFMLSLVLMLAVMSQAQTAVKVAPTMKKGDVRVYKTEVVTSASQEIKVSTEIRYTVADATTSGYVLLVETTSYDTTASGNDLATRLLTMSDQLLRGSCIRIATDKEGKPLSILNADEIRRQAAALADKTYDEFSGSMPELQQLMSKQAFLQQMQSMMTDENILALVAKTTSPLALNGISVTTGAQDYYKNMGMKMKRRYEVKGTDIVTNSTMEMSKEEMKQFVIATAEKMAPAQAEMIRQNIDFVISSGMLKFEMNEHATYQLQDDGWVKSIKAETNSNMMGQTSRSITTTTLQL